MRRCRMSYLIVQLQRCSWVVPWICLCKLRVDQSCTQTSEDVSMLTAISTAFHKGGWGMWPILFTSVMIIAIIVERAVYLFRASVDKDKLLALLKSQVMSGNVQGAIKVCSGNPTPMTRIVQAGLMKFNKSDDEVQIG